MAAAPGDNGTVVLAGWTEGDWARNGTNKDFAVAMVSSEGHVVWRWQVSCSRDLTLSTPHPCGLG